MFFLSLWNTICFCLTLYFKEIAFDDTLTSIRRFIIVSRKALRFVILYFPLMFKPADSVSLSQVQYFWFAMGSRTSMQMIQGISGCVFSMEHKYINMLPLFYHVDLPDCNEKCCRMKLRCCWHKMGMKAYSSCSFHTAGLNPGSRR